MNISIIIPTYNKLPRLKLVMASLKNQKDVNFCFEVIVVDDASADETEQFFRTEKLPFDFSYFKNKTQRGRAYSRNQGVRHARYDIIIFIDDDVILADNFISQHALMQNKEASVVHGKIMDLPYLRYFYDPTSGVFHKNFQNKKQTVSKLNKFCISEDDVINHFDSSVAKQSKIAPLEKMISTALNDYAGIIDWIAFTGGNLSLPRSLFEKVGGFDENFGLNWGCEDLECGYRLFKMKAKFKYATRAVNYHIVHYRADYANEHQENANYFFDKHNEPKIALFQRFVHREMTWDAFIQELLSS